MAGPQAQAFWTRADELFYGGAAGGGKTDLLLGLALAAHDKSIVFRREYSQIKGLIDRSRELLRRTSAKYNGQDNIWRGIPGQRVLEFGAVQYEQDVEKYQGRPHDLIAFDELPHFTKHQYTYLIGWNRTTDPSQRCRIVSAGNPPMDADGEWIIQYWAAWLDPQHSNPARPGELRWYAMIDGEQVEQENGDTFEWKGERITPKSKTFIPAKVTDNPYLMATDYQSRLQAMPEPMRSKLLYGDFGVGFKDDPWQVIPTAWVIAAQDRWSELPPTTQLTGMAADVARGGDDKTVVAKRRKNWFEPLVKHAGIDTPDGQSVARIVIAEREGDIVPAIDIIGVGASAYDMLQAQGIPVRAVNFAEASNEMDKSGQLAFVNKRAEYYWRFREALDPNGGDEIALPVDRELRADLCAARWKMTVRGIQIESKEDIKKRLGRSPDCADAVVMAAHDGNEFRWEFV